MKKETIKLKQFLTDTDMVGFIRDLADSYFSEDEAGNTIYTPYLARIQFRLLFYLYCVDGLTFETIVDESGETVLENILEAADNDEELARLFSNCNDGSYKDLPITAQLSEISADAYDMAEFKKQQLIHGRKDSLSMLIDAITAKVSELDLSKLDIQKIFEDIVNSSLANSNFEEKDKTTGSQHNNGVNYYEN